MTTKLTEYERNEESASRYEEERIDYLFEKWFAGTDLEKNCDESHPIGWRQSIFRWTFGSGYRRGISEDPKNRDVSIKSQGETVTVLVREIADKDKRIAELADNLSNARTNVEIQKQAADTAEERIAELEQLATAVTEDRSGLYWKAKKLESALTELLNSEWQDDDGSPRLEAARTKAKKALGKEIDNV